MDLHIFVNGPQHYPPFLKDYLGGRRGCLHKLMARLPSFWRADSYQIVYIVLV